MHSLAIISDIYPLFIAYHHASDYTDLWFAIPWSPLLATEDAPMLNAIKRFLKNEDGPTAVEYAVMLALIIVLCIVVIRQVGTSASRTFSTADSAIS